MLKSVVVGCGFMGRMHANVYSQLAGADLVGVVDHHEGRGTALADEHGVPLYSSLSQALGTANADVFDICLPTHLHAEATVQCAQAGKHVFCEKPMALNLTDADRMIQACADAGVYLMIGHCIRFWPEYALLKEIVDDQRLGKLTSVNLTRYGAFPSWSSDNWLADESKAGGGALDMHIHDTDYIRYLLGEPKSISSWGTADERGVGQIFTTLEYPEAVAHLEGGWNLPPNTPFKMTFRAIFERGAAIMEDGPMTIYPAQGEPYRPAFPKMSAEGGGNISDLGGYYHELAYFIECLAAGKPLILCTPESSRDSLELALEEIRKVKSR